MLRKSDYCITVKLEEESDKYMLLHSYTGAMDVVSGKIGSILEKKSIDFELDMSLSTKTVEQLKTRGYITEKTSEEEGAYVKRFAALLHKNSMNSSKQYMFMVAYDCNFRCAYCYEGGISKHGNNWSKKTFTKEMVDRAYEAMKEIEPNENMRSKSITLYGGEPFLKENKESVEYIIRRGIEDGYKFDAITNGYDLNHFKEILDTGAITYVQITLDGDKELHDSRRYHYQTKESFDRILANIDMLLDKNIGVNVRFNMDSNNSEHIKKLKQIFDNKGYSQNKYFRFYTALLRGGEGNIDTGSSLMEAKATKNIENSDENYKYLNRQEFNRLNNKIAAEGNYQDYGLYDKLLSAIKYGNYLRVQSIFCGVQSNMFILDPVGDIYNCWETVGVKKHILGNYKEKIVWNDELKNWQGRNIGNTPKCSVCKYSLLCGGGCLAKALRYGGEHGFRASYCDNYGDVVKRTINKVYKDWNEYNKNTSEIGQTVEV